MISFWQSLVILFIALKLCGVIDWSWLYVFAPMIVELLISVCVLSNLHKTNKGKK